MKKNYLLHFILMFILFISLIDVALADTEPSLQPTTQTSKVPKFKGYYLAACYISINVIPLVSTTSTIANRNP